MSRFIGNVGVEEFALEGAMARLERLQQLQIRIQNAPNRAYVIFNAPATRVGLEEVGVDYKQLALESISIGMGAAIAAAIAAVIAIIVKVGSLIFGGGGGSVGGAGGGGGQATPTEVKAMVKAVPVKVLPKVTKIVSKESTEIAEIVESTLPTHTFSLKDSHPIDEDDPMIWVELYGSAGLSVVKEPGSGVKAVALSYYAINHCMIDRRRGSIVWTINALTESHRNKMIEAAAACGQKLRQSTPTFNEYIATVKKYIGGNSQLGEVERLLEKTNASITDVRTSATDLKDRLAAVIDYANDNASALKELSMHQLMRGMAETASGIDNLAATTSDSDDEVEFLSDSNETLEELQGILKNSQLEGSQQIVKTIGHISSVIGSLFSTLREVIAETTKWQADIGTELPKMLIEFQDAAKSARGIDEVNENKRKEFIAKNKDEYEKAISQINELKEAKARELAAFNESLKDNSLVFKMLGIKRT